MGTGRQYPWVSIRLPTVRRCKVPGGRRGVSPCGKVDSESVAPALILDSIRNAELPTFTDVRGLWVAGIIEPLVQLHSSADYERLTETLQGWHWVAAVVLFLRNYFSSA